MNGRDLLAAPAPWNRPQLRMLGVTNTVAAGLIASAWWGSSGEAELAEQVPWLNLGVLAVVVASGVDLLWLGNGWSGLRTRRRELLADIVLSNSPSQTNPRAADLVAVARGRRVHRADCPLVQGKTTTASRSRTGLRPGEVCRP